MKDQQIGIHLPGRGLVRSLFVNGLADRDRLPRLAEVHPGRPAGGRWIGLQTIPTARIRGTASGASRRRDFRPLRGHEPADWTSRWSRLLSSENGLAALPPVSLLRTGGEYWVVDGHNRVALAREFGQLWIDAEVTELDMIAPRG